MKRKAAGKVGKTLKEELSLINPDMNIRIGCKYGNGFIYIGKASGISFQDLNQKSLEQKDRKKGSRLAEWIPIEDRPVLGIFNGLQEPSLVYQINGYESGEDYVFDESRKSNAVKRLFRKK